MGDYGPWPTDPQCAAPYGLLHLCGATASCGHTAKSSLAADGGLKAPSLSDRCVPLVVYYIVRLNNERSGKINDTSIWDLQMWVGDLAGYGENIHSHGQASVNGEGDGSKSVRK